MSLCTIQHLCLYRMMMQNDNTAIIKCNHYDILKQKICISKCLKMFRFRLHEAAAQWKENTETELIECCKRLQWMTFSCKFGDILNTNKIWKKKTKTHTTWYVMVACRNVHYRKSVTMRVMSFGREAYKIVFKYCLT